MTNNTGLDIFISASLKYPELNTIKYQANRELIIFEIALKGKLQLSRKVYLKEKSPIA